MKYTQLLEAAKTLKEVQYADNTLTISIDNDFEIQIEAQTPNTGTDRKSVYLTLTQAKTVYNWLKELGVEE